MMHFDKFVTPLRQIVRHFVCICATCQRNKTENCHPAGLLQPLDVPSTIWQDISLDSIEALPKVHGKSVILTVIDRFSKYARSYLWDILIRHHQLPRRSSQK